MKRMFVLLFLLVSAMAVADELTMENIQGKWRIVTMGNSPVTDTDDVWEFKGSNWIAWSEGKALSPDPFKLNKNVIDLGYGKITVLEKSKNAMKTDYLGMVYTFKKIN